MAHLVARLEAIRARSEQVASDTTSSGIVKRKHSAESESNILTPKRGTLSHVRTPIHQSLADHNEAQTWIEDESCQGLEIEGYFSVTATPHKKFNMSTDSPTSTRLASFARGRIRRQWTKEELEEQVSCQLEPDAADDSKIESDEEISRQLCEIDSEVFGESAASAKGNRKMSPDHS